MKPDRILVRAPTWIGNAVMATPVLRALRGAYPQAEIVVEGRPLLAELLAGLAEVKALVRRAKLLLTNDTGPRQIAIAVGTPVVVLMGPTDPRRTQQHMERQRVLREDVDCSPCQLKTCPIDHRCMTRLSPERAISAAQELIVESLPD